MSRRVGFIVPSVNSVVEHDLRAGLPEDVDACVARWRTAPDPEGSTRALAQLPDVARTLVDAEVEQIVFACTAGSAVGGALAERRTVEQLHAVTGVPVITTAGALAFDARRLGLMRVLMCSPFDAAHAAPEADGLRDLGVPVADLDTWGLRTPGECRSLTPRAIADLVVTAVTRVGHGSHDAVLISCANVRALEAVDDLEARLGLPVLTSNRSVIDAVVGRERAPRPEPLEV